MTSEEKEQLYQEFKARLIEELNLSPERLSRAKPFDYAKFVEIYNETFATPTGNPLCEVVSEKRKAAIRKAWKFDTTNAKDKLRTDNFDYWKRYWGYCSGVEFFTKTDRKGEHANWRPDFDFMIRESTHIGAREGKYQ